MPRKRKQPRVRYCEFCGHPFGIERGPAAKTCSPECQRDRNNAREKERYERVKGTDRWKAVRARYLGELRERMAADPALADRLRAAHKAALARFRAALEKDPARLEAYRQQQRQWHKDLTPEKRAARKSWYRSLTPERKELFLLDLRERRARERLEP